MNWNQKPIPSLPCPYCLRTFSYEQEWAVWMGENGGDPETATPEIMMHMEVCDAKDDPAADGFVEASELAGLTNKMLGFE